MCFHRVIQKLIIFLKKNFINIFQYKKHYEIFKKKNPDQNIYYNRINIDRLFNGKMAGLQRATLNLLLHNPKKIFITNVNFFLNLNYKKNYSNNMNIFKNKGVLRSFMNHDPLYQFLIIKNLFKKN